jgi:hypothetical protein
MKEEEMKLEEMAENEPQTEAHPLSGQRPVYDECYDGATPKACCARPLLVAPDSQRSNCHGAGVTVMGDGHLHYYRCDECGESCDVAVPGDVCDVPVTTDDKAKAALKRIDMRLASPWNIPLPPELEKLSLQPHIDRIIKGITIENRKFRLMGVSEGLNLCYQQLKGKASELFMLGDDVSATNFRTAMNSVKVLLDLNRGAIQAVEEELDAHSKEEPTDVKKSPLT